MKLFRATVSCLVVSLVAATALGPAIAQETSGPLIRSFTAEVSAPNNVTLTWQTSEESSGTAYIYGPRFAPDNRWYHDIGFTMRDSGFTRLSGKFRYSVTFRVRAGTHRYTLEVPGSDGRSDTARVHVHIPDPALVAVTTPQTVYVDIFNIGDTTIAWEPRDVGFVRVWKPDRTFVSTTEHSFVVPAEELRALGEGSHAFRLQPCHGLGTNLCGEESFVVIVIGGALFDGPFREFLPASPSSDFTLSWQGGGNRWLLYAPTLGIHEVVEEQTHTIPRGSLTPGQHKLELRSCQADVGLSAPECSVSARLSPLPYVPTEARKEIIVGDTSWTEKHWTEDFDAETSRAVETGPHSYMGNGVPLDVTFDSRGDVWSIGEWADSMMQVSDDQVVKHEVPMRRYLDPGSGLRHKVRPFSDSTGKRTSLSGYQESILEIDGEIWYTQGGHGIGDWDIPNHSRIVRFDPDGVDSPATETDERFCVYNVPENNNGVTGMAWDGERIWFAEFRFGTGEDSLLTSFDPDELDCDNFLDYEDDAAISGAAHQYCTRDDQTGCFRKVAVPSDLKAPGHLRVDHEEGAIWFTAYASSALGRYDMATGEIQRFPAPSGGTSAALGYWFGTGPWQIRLDGDFVYFSEFADGDVVRFDKRHARSECDTLDGAGRNPCMDEIHVPLPVSTGRVHSIDIHDGRLWFTAATSNHGRGDVADDSAIGYVDLSNWGSGVIYRGMGPDLIAPERLGTFQSSYSGIAIDPATGRVAVNDYFRRQVLVLQPVGAADLA